MKGTDDDEWMWGGCDNDDDDNVDSDAFFSADDIDTYYEFICNLTYVCLSLNTS